MCFYLFFWGVAGGVSADILLLYRARDGYLGVGIRRFLSLAGRNFGYFAITAVMNVMGGLVVVAYCSSGFQLSPLIAFHLGASTPLFLTKIAAVAPDPLRSHID